MFCGENNLLIFNQMNNFSVLIHNAQRIKRGLSNISERNIDYSI